MADRRRFAPERWPAWSVRWVNAARDRVLDVVGWGARYWRRSLQLRVAVTTMAVTVVVVVVLGIILLTQIADGLLTAKRSAAIEQSTDGVRYVGNQLAVTDDLTGPDVRTVLDRTARELSQRGSAAGLFEIVLVSSDGGQDEQASTGASVHDIPADLREKVADGMQAYRNAVVALDDGEGPQTVLIVGSEVPSEAGHFELYYLFPLAQESKTLALIYSTVIVAGLALVLLVASIGLLMTRLVVQPVRTAAETAGRLAAGRLEERMTVRGEDDLARLATSFNDMADSLQQQITQLEELSRLQQRFTSDVSHELRTPLTTVRMAADVLYDGRDEYPAVAARSAELLHTELGRFESLLADLLEISRYDAGVTALEPEQVDLIVLVERVIEHGLPVASRQGCDIILRAPSEPVIAEVDTRRVDRILRNLLANAVEHGESLPVEVTIAGGDDAVAVSVRDHGVGLASSDLDQVFNRFWRADPSRQRRLGGTGLGLSISREDARLHGGWLDVWGSPGQGASFRLTLPRRAGEWFTESPLPLVPGDLLSDSQAPHDPDAGGTSDDAPLDDVVADDSAPDDVPDDGAGDGAAGARPEDSESAADETAEDGEPDGPDLPEVDEPVGRRGGRS